MQRLKKGAFTSQSCEETDLTGTLQFSHCGEMWPLLSGTQSVYSGVIYIPGNSRHFPFTALMLLFVI